MTPSKRLTRLRRWAHRHGIARHINSSYYRGAYRSVSVDTAFPSKALARYACPYFGMRVTTSSRLGRLGRRWRLEPCEPRRFTS